LEDLRQVVIIVKSGYQHPWDELTEGGNVILHVACESTIELMGRKKKKDLVERELDEAQIHEVHNAHWDEVVVVSRGWAGPSSSMGLDSYLELKATKHTMKMNAPHDAWTKRKRWQEDLHEHDHMEIALNELTS
jgi:hypothetical protein